MLPKDNDEELYYYLALNFVNGIGGKIGKALLRYFGSAATIFKAPLKQLLRIEGITEIKAKNFKDSEVFKKAEKELDFIQKHDIEVLLYTHQNYPERLTKCADAPLTLYYKGNARLDMKKVVAIVGTRKSTDYGLKLTEELISGLQTQEDILIVSGLAFGIDAIAHKKAVKLNMPTVGVLGHGLDMIYPAMNKSLANDMLQNGGLLSEFTSGTGPDRTNFPMRNRIVAGISDVTIVVESDIAGGALITALMANGYNREVAAYPGRVTDAKSSGCNELIRTNIAAMITQPEDLLQLMNWGTGSKPKSIQKQLFLNLTANEQKIIDMLQAKASLHADELMHGTGLANSQLAATLLQLEMQDIVKTLPGKYYRLC